MFLSRKLKYVHYDFVVILLLAAPALAQNISGKITVADVQREYIVHLPANFNALSKHALVFAFHGGGGNAKRSLVFFGLNAVADTAGFIVVYPNGINKGWNDGRQVKKHSHDDVGFIRALIEQLIKTYPIDEGRIFATGISNGGFFSFALALHLGDKIRAIAPVCATIPLDIFQSYAPARPVDLLLINGTKDSLVPYGGGKVGGRWLSRGQCVSTDETMNKFLSINRCDAKATQTPLPDRVKDDGCTATRFSYACAGNYSVQLIRIDGGGHTWPGGKQYLGKRLVGKVCRDFSAAGEIWNFFRSIH